MTWFDETTLERLTEPQRAAVTHVDGPLLVLAGPGSGKTRVITQRIAYLIAQGIPAWTILAMTFTNKAAGEMRQRVDAMVPAEIPGRRGLTVTTFHTFCSRVLRRYAERQFGEPSDPPHWFKISPRFTIYDGGDQRQAIKQALTETGLDSSNFPPATVASAISRAKNQLLDAAAYAAQASDFRSRSMAKVFTAYQAILHRSDAADFDDLLLLTARLLKEDQAARQALQQRYQYILIDEYQDTNHAQFLIAHALAAGHRNICVVGDPDQSIYAWRGADLNNILEFERQYPEAKVIALGQNFRSTGHIVAAASTLIQHNRRRKHKDLHTDLGDGIKPLVVACGDEHHEARAVADELRRLHEQHTVDWREMAVLYRINALSRVIEEVLRDAGMPYVIARGTAFYDRKEIKDALSYLRLIVNPDDEMSLLRVINTPSRGISKPTVDALQVHAMHRQSPLGRVLREVDQAPGLNARAVTAVGKFVAMLEAWRQAAAERAVDGQVAGEAGANSPLAALVERVIIESGLEAALKKTHSEEDEERLENLAELISAAAQFNPADEEAAADQPRTTRRLLERYLESVALVSDADMVDSGSGAITLMTLHAAKGLEFDVIAMIGLEDGLLPHSRSLENEAALEEERRLCFVGMTRARKHLIMSRAAFRAQRGMREMTVPSPFLAELPEQAIEHRDMASAADAMMDDDPLGMGDDRPRWGAASYDTAASMVKDFPVGALVRHPSFGLGRIEFIGRQGSATRAKVAFTRGGTKTLILEYAKLQRVD